MIQLVSISIRVRTADGVFGTNMDFDNGFNIIRGDNTSGKSTLFQAILYALGAEELLGSKGRKTMQSALRDQVKDINDRRSNVLESYVDLVVENSSRIRIRRFVISNNKSDKLIQINTINKVDNEVLVPAISTWIHDRGGASNEKYGFHAYFAKFIGFELPSVFYNNSDYRLLYLQTIFPAFIIEQKKGWADFLFTIPYYGIKDPKSRVVEFILNLDVYRNEKLKIELKNEVRSIEKRWSEIYSELNEVAASNSLRLTGVSKDPEYLQNEAFHSLRIFNNGELVDLQNYLFEQSKILETLKSVDITTTGKNLSSIEKEIKLSQAKLDELTIQYELDSRKLKLVYSNEENYQSQLRDILKEIDNNKDANKLMKLGDENPILITDNVCPTCKQEIKNSLLPENIPHIPMSLDENIKFLKDQEKLIKSYLNKHRNDSKLLNTSISSLYGEISSLRQRIRTLKQELVSDERIPSISQVEKMVHLEANLKSLYLAEEKIDEKIETLRIISENWEEIKKKQSKLPKEFLSKVDRKKLELLEDNFKRLLGYFGYDSKPIDSIYISIDNYLPVVNENNNFYDIRYDSSASDLIRAIWSYTCSLYLVSKEYGGNHPGLLMFDEPGQQSMSNTDFNKFFKELSNYKEDQVLLFASFNNSDSDYEEAIQDVADFKLNRINKKLLLKE